MDCQQNTKKNIVFKIKLLVPTEVLTSAVLYYITQPLYLRVYVLSYNQQQVRQYVSERYNNTIHKRFLRSKTIKVILSSTTRIRPTVCMEDFEEALSVNHAYIEDTEVEETTIVDIITIGHFVGSNAISVINLNASQVSIQQKRDNKYILNISNMPNI